MTKKDLCTVYVQSVHSVTLTILAKRLHLPLGIGLPATVHMGLSGQGM